MPFMEMTDNQIETTDIARINGKQFSYIKNNWFIQTDEVELMIKKTTVEDCNNESERLKTMMHLRFNYIRDKWPVQPYRIYIMLSETTPYTYNYVQRILAEKRRA